MFAEDALHGESARNATAVSLQEDQETNRLFLDTPVGLRGTSPAPYLVMAAGTGHIPIILSRRFGRPRR